MSMKLSALFLACGMAASGLAQAFDEPTRTTAAELRDQALRGSGAYDTIASLTTEVGPRLAGSEGDKKAVAWAVKMLKAKGFDRVWTEPVRFPAWTRSQESAEILAPFPQKLAITALGHSEGTPAGGIAAEVVRYESLEALQADTSGRAKGKIVFIDRRMERARDGGGYGPVVAARTKGVNAAADKGALALVIRSVGTDSDRFPHTGVSHYDEKQTTRIPAAALSNPDADLLARVLGYGKPTRLKLKLDVANGPEVETANVIAEIRGREKPEEVVLLGAHLDSWDLGTGALDDGAGVAIVSQAGALIGALPQAPKRTIRVVLFANEETGLVGAKAYNSLHKDELKHHIIGAESDFGAGPIYRLSSTVPDALLPALDGIVKELAPLGISRGDNTSSGGPDMRPMQGDGMPVAELAQDGTDYFDFHHTANDTLDKVNPKHLDQNVAAYVVFAYLMAQH
ncbi:MAG: M28 family peptidase [Gammaproteobacteria bacterium]|nr:M28 family peptidase [Gammaproteobacteria bacterium]